MIHMQSEK